MGATVPPPKRAKDVRVVARASTPPPGMLARTGADALQPSAQRRSYRECFERFTPDATAIAASDVVVFRGDASLALTNVRVALDNLAPYIAQIPAHLPMVRPEAVTSTADVARAVVYAGMVVPQQTASPAEVRLRLGRVVKPRAQMLGVLRTAVERDELPAAVLDGVGTARGPRAMASDAVKIAEAFTAHAAALQGKHPFTAAEIAALRTDGEWLLDALKPANARKPRRSREATPKGDRDRLWTLLVQRHALLRKVAHYFCGEDFEAVVPALLSRVKAELPAERIDGPPAPAPAPVG